MKINPVRPKHQGKVVIERDAITHTFLIVLPNGEVHESATKQAATKLVNRWLKRDIDADSIGVAVIEWRM